MKLYFALVCFSGFCLTATAFGAEKSFARRFAEKCMETSIGFDRECSLEENMSHDEANKNYKFLKRYYPVYDTVSVDPEDIEYIITKSGLLISSVHRSGKTTFTLLGLVDASGNPKSRPQGKPIPAGVKPSDLPQAETSSLYTGIEKIRNYAHLRDEEHEKYLRRKSREERESERARSEAFVSALKSMDKAMRNGMNQGGSQYGQSNFVPTYGTGYNPYANGTSSGTVSSGSNSPSSINSGSGVKTASMAYGSKKTSYSAGGSTAPSSATAIRPSQSMTGKSDMASRLKDSNRLSPAYEEPSKQEEVRRKQEEVRRKQEEERRKQDEERRKQEEDRRKQEEERRKQDEERRKQDEERRKQEEERSRQEDARRKEQDNGCWHASTLSAVSESIKHTAPLCEKDCLTLTVKNISEGRIIAKTCIKRGRGLPDDCIEFSLRPGASKSHSGSGVDYSTKYWGSDKPQNDWVCKK